ncbi:iron-containing alcohol dehydrogenase [Metamycoplasma hominis]|uniref:iron-containing alcohol dehydrogenase n=1 Tax=Metamycoplasma hominis TaxID=2098 RepID=UPI003CF105F4
MLNFIYKNDCKIIFGKESIQNLEEELKSLKVKKILIVYSGKYIFELKIYDEIIKACKKLNIEFIENGNVVPNPRIELVRKLVLETKAQNVDFILAIGGGSVIDTAKAIAVGAKSDVDVWKFYTYEDKPNCALPIGVISTMHLVVLNRQIAQFCQMRITNLA